jgi:hypothetical protein
MKSNEHDNEDIIVTIARRLQIPITFEDMEEIIENLILEGTPREIMHPTTRQYEEQLEDLIEDHIREIKLVNKKTHLQTC